MISTCDNAAAEIPAKAAAQSLNQQQELWDFLRRPQLAAGEVILQPEWEHRRFALIAAKLELPEAELANMLHKLAFLLS